MVRKAKEKDLSSLKILIDFASRKGFILPRSKREIKEYPVLKTTPIICLVESSKPYTGTLRYKPVGIEPEIGDPHIPLCLANGDARYLMLTVHWGLSVWMLKGSA